MQQIFYIFIHSQKWDWQKVNSDIIEKCDRIIQMQYEEIFLLFCTAFQLIKTKPLVSDWLKDESIPLVPLGPYYFNYSEYVWAHGK